MFRPIPSAAMLGLLASIAHAADPDPLLDAPEVVLEEARSGLYLRGDLGIGVGSDLDGTRVLAVPGGVLAVPLGAGLEDAASVGLGVGYRLGPMLRGDATLRYAEPTLDAPVFALPGCGALCAGFEGGHAGTLDLMANGYLDLGTVAGLTPYVGAGLGAVRVDYGDLGAATCGLAGCASLALGGESDWRFSYALNAGVAYDLTSALTLDLGYRYTDVEGGEAWRASAAAGPAFHVSDDGFRRHAISLGLRFDLP